MGGFSAIDLDPKLLEKNGKHITQIIKMDVPLRTLNSLLEDEIHLDREVDIVSVDVEGGEMNVLKGFDLEKYKPKVMVVENIFNEPEINAYLEQFNYVLDQQIEYNQYYRLKDYTFKLFDWEFYLDTYPDLRPNGVTDETKAFIHWNRFGRNEGRKPRK